MKSEGKTTVLESGGAKLIRWYSYGFRCNSLHAHWGVEVNGHEIWACPRKKDAMPVFQRAAALLREANGAFDAVSATLAVTGVAVESFAPSNATP